MRLATRSRTPEADVQRIRAQKRVADQPIRYKLPTHISPTSEPDNRSTPGPATEGIEEDYAPLVRGALRAATLMVLAQVGTSVITANIQGALVRVAFWSGVIPYIQIQTTPTVYSRIWMWSIIAGVAAGCGGALYALWRHRLERNLLDGWGTGIVMAGLLIAIQAGQQVFFGPLINSWALAQAGAAVLATAAVFLGLRPEAECRALSGLSARSNDPRRRGPFNRTNSTPPPTK